MSDAYRTPGELPAPMAVLPPRGLVRANGVACNCRPPGHLWCWWFGVVDDDRWYCEHGGGWVRKWDARSTWLHSWMVVAAPSESPARGGSE